MRPPMNILAARIRQCNLRVRSVVPTSIPSKTGRIRLIVYISDSMRKIGVVGIAKGMLALRKGGYSATAKQRRISLPLVEIAVIDLLEIFNMHQLGNASMLANQLNSVPIRLSLVGRPFWFGQRREPFVLLISLMGFGLPP